MTAWEDITAAGKPITDRLESELGIASVKLQAALADLSEARSQVTGLTVQVNMLNQEKAALLQRIKELENPTPTQRMYAGACPTKTGSSNKTLADQQRVKTKWGDGCAVRQFFGGITDIAPRDPKVGIVHASWKEFTKANLTETKVKAAVANLLAGDVVEVGHESNNDGLSVAATTTRIDIKNTFYDVIKKVRPDLLVANTVTGWALDPKSKTDNSRWVGEVKADILGVDCDGIRPSTLPYTNYKDEFTTALALIEQYKAKGYRWVAMPEYGCPRIDAEDADGVKRAAYHDEYMTLWRDSKKVLYVMLYEYDSSPNYSLTTSAEITGFKKWVNA